MGHMPMMLKSHSAQLSYGLHNPQTFLWVWVLLQRGEHLVGMPVASLEGAVLLCGNNALSEQPHTAWVKYHTSLTVPGGVHLGGIHLSPTHTLSTQHFTIIHSNTADMGGREAGRRYIRRGGDEHCYNILQ